MFNLFTVFYYFTYVITKNLKFLNITIGSSFLQICKLYNNFNFQIPCDTRNCSTTTFEGPNCFEYICKKIGPGPTPPPPPPPTPGPSPTPVPPTPAPTPNDKSEIGMKVAIVILGKRKKFTISCLYKFRRKYKLCRFRTFS